MEKSELYSPTPYDDVFRTLVNRCSQLLIPLINEVFGESYTGEERIEFAQNELMQQQQEGAESRRITDTVFTIHGSTRKKYHLECESAKDASSILIRIFEYDAQIALEQDSELTGNRLLVSFPNSAVLFLRSRTGTADTMEIVIRVLDEQEIRYSVPVIKLQRYSMDEIFDKNLLFLIPFYIFTYEAQFSEMEKDPARLENLRKEFESIVQKLEQLQAHGRIDAYYLHMIMNMSERVIVNLTKKYRIVQKKMEDVMVGRIIETEASRIYDAGQAKGVAIGEALGKQQGREEGKIEGREQGREEGKIEGREERDLESIRNLMETMNLSGKQAMDALKIPPDKQEDYAKKLGLDYPDAE